MPGRPAAAAGPALLAIYDRGMVGFLALAIDLGMLAIAKTQAQQAADLAALTARTLNGRRDRQLQPDAATTNAQNVMTYNASWAQPLQLVATAAYLRLYDYNQTTQTFNANYPATTGQPTTAVDRHRHRRTSSAGRFQLGLRRTFLPSRHRDRPGRRTGRATSPWSMDLSGSMRFGTCLGFDFYTYSRTSNNPDHPLSDIRPVLRRAMPSCKGPAPTETSSDESYTISPSNTTAPNSSYSLTY